MIPSSFARPGLRWPLFAAASTLLLGPGCGLTDYEAKMASEQKRLEHLDTENYLLGEPIEIPPPPAPPADQEPKPAPEVFFRPPLGISKTFEVKPLGELLYRHAKVGQAAYVPPSRRLQAAGTSSAENPIQEVDVAVAGDRERDDFWQKVLAPFEHYQKSEVTQVVKEPPDRERLQFSAQTFTFTEANKPGGWTYLVYFYQKQNWHVAIVFLVPMDKATSQDVTRVVDLSLQSLGVGPEAALQQRRYHPPPKGAR